EAEPRSARGGARKSSAKDTARKSRRRGEPSAEAEAAPAEVESFERITDEDVAEDAGDLLKDAILQEKIIEQVHRAEYATPPVVREPEPEWRVGSFQAPVVEDASFQRILDESAPSLEKPTEYAAHTREQSGSVQQPASSFRHVGEALAGWAERLEGAGIVEPDAPRDEMHEGSPDLEDRQAEVSDRGTRGEFSQRRGG